MVRLFDAAKRAIVPRIVVPGLNLPAGGEYGWFLIFLIMVSPLDVISEFVLKQADAEHARLHQQKRKFPLRWKKVFRKVFTGSPGLAFG